VNVVSAAAPEAVAAADREPAHDAQFCNPSNVRDAAPGDRKEPYEAARSGPFVRLAAPDAMV